MQETNRSRRDLLKTVSLAGLGLAAGAALSSCSPKEKAAPAATSDGMDMPSSSQSGTLTPELIDKAHETVVKAFPAQTAGKGNEPLTPKLDGDWKVFEITCKEVEWEVAPGIMVPVWSYNGTVPGPMIRVKVGDKVRVVCQNELAESTSIHFHGVAGVPNAQDGVPYITQPPIAQGETFTYEFTVKYPGLHMYHTHHNAYEQMTKGLMGLFVVDPADNPKPYGEDLEIFMVLNDGHMGYTINGKRFPATEPYVAKLGQRVRVRYANVGAMVHPLHLHGFPMQVVEKDGWPLPQPYTCDTVAIAPGERYDAIVVPDVPGAWALHCHVLPHAESNQGMHGMVTALIVQP